MSDLSARIAEVLCGHSVSKASTIGGHAQQYDCRCGEFHGTWLGWSRHVAAAVAAEPSRETQAVTVVSRHPGVAEAILNAAASERVPCPQCGYQIDPERRWCPKCLKWTLLDWPAPDSGLEGI